MPKGVQVSWYAGLRAYFVSQLGKYVPGKAWVILMRVGMLRHDAHAHPIPVAVTATYETLCSMAAGALLGVLLLPQLGVLPVEVSGKTTAPHRGGGPAGRARRAEQVRGPGGRRSGADRMRGRYLLRRSSCWHRDSCTEPVGSVCWG